MLVIIGLLAGGVLAGRDLIHAATLQSQVTQLQQYDLAYKTFRTKYNCIPGDCAGLGTYFSSVVDGNGNGMIENNLKTYYDASGSITWALSNEYQYFFIDMALAGYIPGSFDASAVIGKGMPSLKYKSNASFFASDARSFQVLNPSASRNPDTLAYRHGNNWIWMVACNVTGPSPWLWDDGCGIFTTDDLFRIDEKMDDGKPLSGHFMGFGGANSNNNCLTGTAYNPLGGNSAQCLAAFQLD